MDFIREENLCLLNFLKAYLEMQERVHHRHSLPGPDCWNSEHTSLNPFTYPVPETRFFHAGVNVYKFKIKYGNSVSTNIDLNENIINEELEEAIQVILGNLNNLYPFTTEHLVVFPYKAEYRDACNFADNTSKLSTNMDTERAMKWRRQECSAEISHAQLYVDRNLVRDAARICGATRPHVGKTRLQKDVIHPRENLPEEIQLWYSGAAIVNSGYDNMTLGEHLEYDKAENSDHGQQDGPVPVLPQGPEEHTQLKKRGVLELLKSTLFLPLLQRIFSGISQPS